MSESMRQYLDRRYRALMDERASWEPRWREISEYLLPRHSRFLMTDANRGNRKNSDMSKIVDSTAVYALRTLSSGMMSGITSPARPWFRLTVPDPQLADDQAVRSWLYEVEQRMREVFTRSNLYNVLPQIYQQMAGFGTAAMGVLEHPDEVVRFYPFPIGSYAVSNNGDLRVDTFVRQFRMTVRQLVQDFGEDAVSDRVKNAYKNGRLEQWIDVIHLVEPNWWQVPEREDFAGKAYRSVYYEKGANDDQVLRTSGFDEFPILCPRWEVTGEDVYGDGPGHLSLGDIKQLQAETRRKAQGIEKMVNPPMVADVSLRQQRSSVLPGDVTYVDMQGQGANGFRPAYEVNPRINELLQDIREIQDRIDRAFYVDLFLMLTYSDRRQITAREIEERHEEKLLMLGPVLERIEDELLDPLIDRTFNIMARNGLIPEPPEALQGVDLRVEYQSILAQAQKMVGIQGIDRLVGFVGNVAQAKPEVLDKMDAERAVSAYADALGTPPDLLKSDEDVEAMRQQRAEQAAQQQALAAAQQAGQAAKDMGDASTQEGTALGDLLRTVGR